MTEGNENEGTTAVNTDMDSLPNPIHEAILQTLASAVISLEAGVVSYFNEAAAELTGLRSEEVLGSTFAEVFLGLEDAGEFAEAVLDAIYEGNLVRHRVVNATFPSGKQVLSVSVTRTRSSEQDESIGDSLAVVFEDISEVLELREKELVLAQEVEAQHAELRDAYVELEERNRHLAEAQSRMRLARFSGAGGVVVLLVMLVLWVALGGSSTTDAEIANQTSVADAAQTQTIVVEAQPLTTTVSVIGRLGPKREVEVTSPISGKVAVVHVPYGSTVTVGQPLLDLDVTQVQIQQRDAQASYIKARERLQEVENWSDSVEASRARRSVTKARIDLSDSKRRLDETTFLLDRGVVPATEQEAAQRNHRGRELDLEAAEQDLTVILEKGTADARIAKLELENAEARLREIEQTISLASIAAPISGVVMRPQSSAAADGQQQSLGAGTSVSIGEHLLTIGDIEGLSVLGQVDEVDVVQIRVGNSVRVTGEAFPGVVLNALIRHVSSEAIVGNDRRSIPFFETIAVVDQLNSEQLELLRIGMTVAMEVVVREENEALLVPVEAVEFVDGETVVNVVADGGHSKPVAVGTGVTTLESVEIISGLAPGDQIRVPVR